MPSKGLFGGGGGAGRGKLKSHRPSIRPKQIASQNLKTTEANLMKFHK